MEILLEITDLSRSGAGLGRDANGRAVFVPFTAPGDLARVEIVTEEKRYAEGRLLELVRRSETRSEPPCPVFGRCGGCEWQHIPYERQWEAKRQGVLHALARVGTPTDGVPWTDLPAEQIWEYRNRVQLKGDAELLGFYERRSTKIVNIDKCWIARPELNALLAGTREEGRARPREYKVELEVFPDGTTRATWNRGHSASGFRQVHDAQNDKLRAWVDRSTAEERGILLDLFGGSGNLSVGIAARFAEAHCVDLATPSAPPAGLAHFRFHRSEVAPWLARQAPSLRARGLPITAVLDPPREGLGPELVAIVESLKMLEAARVVLIGCEADTWAKAVHRFARHGWIAREFGALDFFPQTHHVEALALLGR